MKQLIETYIEENYSISVKELALIKAHLIYTKSDTLKDNFNLDRASVLEDLEKELLLPNGYSITTQQELKFTIAQVLDIIIEYYANDILDNLNNL